MYISDNIWRSTCYSYSLFTRAWIWEVLLQHIEIHFTYWSIEVSILLQILHLSPLVVHFRTVYRWYFSPYLEQSFENLLVCFLQIKCIICVILLSFVFLIPFLKVMSHFFWFFASLVLCELFLILGIYSMNSIFWHLNNLNNFLCCSEANFIVILMRFGFKLYLIEKLTPLWLEVLSSLPNVQFIWRLCTLILETKNNPNHLWALWWFLLPT